MFYDFKKFNTDNATEMDKVAIHDKIAARFPGVEGDDLTVALKKLIKNESDFKEFTGELEITVKEMVKLLIFTYPDIFNYSLIKFCRKKYTIKEISEFMKL